MHEYHPESAIINPADFKRRKIVFSENKRTYECVNDTSDDVVMLHIDGGLFSGPDAGTRCDYGFEAEGECGNRICLVELKGHDTKHACEQLLTTLSYFEKNYPASKFFCRVVSSGNKKPNIESPEKKKLSRHLREKSYGKLKTGTNKISEKLSELK